MPSSAPQRPSWNPDTHADTRSFSTQCLAPGARYEAASSLHYNLESDKSPVGLPAALMADHTPMDELKAEAMDLAGGGAFVNLIEASCCKEPILNPR